MYFKMTPDEILADEEFSVRNAGSIIALIASCHRHNVDPASLEMDWGDTASLPASRFQAYVNHLLAASKALYGEDTAYFWSEALEELKQASQGLTRWDSLGMLSPDCTRVVVEGIEVLSEVKPVVLPLDAEQDEAFESDDIEPIDQPARPFRASLYTLWQLLRAGEEDALSAAQRGQAVEAVEYLRSPEALRYFEAGVDAVRHGAPHEDDRDVNLLEAMALRELGNKLYALDGDEALLRALERVDDTLNDPRYRDALLSVDEERWELGDEDRVPSEHWWGVRTRAEMFGAEFASEIADALAAQGAHEEALFTVIRGAITEALTTAAHKVHQSLDAVAQALRSAVDTLALPTPLPAYGWRSKDDDEIPAPLTWQVPNSNCVAILSFPPRALLRADTALRMSIWDAPGVVRRVALGDLVRRADTTETESFALFTLEELQQARQLGTHGIGGLGIEVEIDGKPRWIAGILPIN